MGSTLEIAVQMRRIVIILSRTCYRSVCNHPFLLGILCFLLLLYRSFPFLFSLLVSASPMLFCTAVLLGTLLSFGHPNIVPEIEKDDDGISHSHDIASLKATVSRDTAVVVDDERDKSFPVERYTGKGSNIVEEVIEGPSSIEDKVGKVDTFDSLVDCVSVIAHSSREIQLAEDIEGASSVEDKVGKVDLGPLNDHSSREIQLEKRVTGEVEGNFNGLGLEKKGEFQEENLGIECVSYDGEAPENQCFVVHEVGDKILEVEDNVKHPGGLADAHNGDHFYLYPNDDEDGDDESSDRGSDLAESSSPDASMADIFPILDELHPLLDPKAPQPAHMSHADESDAASEHSCKSNDASIESDEELEIHGDEEDGVDENEDDEEEAQGGKEDDSKSAIKWTEDDQKNLMDLGTSELERNQRLENLIARRRARKNMRLMAEKNLIDLDGADLPFNVPPISTARRNPFDLPYDPYDPPGSAPSILLPMRNPFDLPYDRNEEKPDLKGDGFQQEFMTFQQRDTLFHRHESFNIGPSGLGGSRQERHDVRFRPFFVPERFTSEGTSYSSFERQSSEVSESKLSSIPDTESVSSAADRDDKKLNELDLCQEIKLISSIDHASDRVESGSEFYENIDSVEMEQVKRDVCHDKVEITLGQVGNRTETDSGLSTTGGVAVPLELSASEIHLKTQHFVYDDEVEITFGQVGNQAEMDSGLSETGTGGVAIPLELRTHEIHLKREPVGEEYSSRSSLSSLSEIDGRLLYATKEESASLEPRGNDLEESRSAMLPSSKEPDFHFLSGGVDENQHEPVYVSSPPEGENIFFQPSISSDLQAETSKMGSSPVSVATSVPISDKESELYSEIEGMDYSNYKETHGSSSMTHPDNETEPILREAQESSMDRVTPVDSSGINLGDKNESENVVEHVSVTSRSSYTDVGSVEEGIVYKKDSLSRKQDQVSSSSNDSEIIFGIHQDVHEKPDSEASSYQVDSENLTLSRKVEQHPLPSVGFEHVSVISSETEPFERHAISKIKTSLQEQDQVYSSNSLDYGSTGEGLMHSNEVLQPEHDQVQLSIGNDAETDKSSYQDGGEKLDLVASSPQHIPSSEEQQPPLVTEKVITDLSSETEHMEDWSLNKEEIVWHKQDEVPSSSSDAKIYAGHHQGLDVNVVSLGYDGQYVPSEEKALSGSEKHLAYADKPMVEASFDYHDECTESYSIQTESSEVVKITDNEDGLIVHDPECKIRPDLSSSTSVSTQINIPHESPEYILPSSGLDLKADVLGGIVIKEQTKVSEDFSYPAEVYSSSHAEHDVNEVDEIKEIDEGLLSELDAVGDFRVKEVVESTEFELLPNDSEPAKTGMGLPVLEARSLEDINLAFEQLHEGVDVEEVILPSMVDDWLVVGESKDHVESNSSLKTVDAKSLEDIHIALKQVSQDNAPELPRALDPKDQSAVVETCQVASAKEIESTDMGTTSTVAPDKPEKGCDETPEIIYLSMSDRLDTKSKEEKSHGARSSSSSNSSPRNSD